MLRVKGCQFTLSLSGVSLSSSWPFLRVSQHWYLTKDGNKRALALYERHYSCRRYADGRVRRLFCGPGEKMVLLARNSDALFVWRKFIDKSGQSGINCAVFRNESCFLSSMLIREAMMVAAQRWPEVRFYTYVDPRRVASRNPGYCFLKAGWRRCGRTKCNKLIILSFNPNQRDEGGLTTPYHMV